MMTPHSCVAVVVVLCLFRACYLKPFRQPSVRLNGVSFRKIHPQQRDLPPVHSCLVVVLCLSPAHYSKPFSATAFLQYSTATKRNDERGECDFYQPTWKSVPQQYKYQPCHHACLGACRTHSSLRFGHNALPQQLGLRFMRPILQAIRLLSWLDLAANYLRGAGDETSRLTDV